MRFLPMLFNLTKMNPITHRGEFDFNILLDDQNYYVNNVSSSGHDHLKRYINKWADEKYKYLGV